MKKILFILTIFSLIVCRCQYRKDNYNERLTQIDSLLDNYQIETAQILFAQLNKKKIHEEELLAYHNLISTELAYMQYRHNLTNDPINQSIAFYEKNKMLDKLAKCYYYKSTILYDSGSRKEAICNIKKAEQIAGLIKNLRIETKIYSFLSQINLNNEDYALAMQYARKYRTSAEQYNCPIDKIDSYNRIAILHYYLMQDDSARYYINKCIPLLKYAPDSAKIIYLDNIGYLNMNRNPKLALKYLNIAMKLGPSVDTYDNLAQIYIKQGEKEKADSLWRKALQTQDLAKKIEILSTILRQKQEEKDYKKVAHFASWLVELKDSLADQRKSEQILVQQIKFDNDLAQAKQQKTILTLTYAICIAVLLLVLICLSIRYHHMKTINEKLENEKKIKEYQITIDKLASIGQTDHKTIENLQKRIDKLQYFKDNHTQQGHILYETALFGKSIKDWNKPKMITFLDYYVSKDIEYSLSLEEIDQLTAREKIFLILQHEGKTEAKVAEMMALSNSALRTMKSRIKKKKESK